MFCSSCVVYKISGGKVRTKLKLSIRSLWALSRQAFKFLSSRWKMLSPPTFHWLLVCRSQGKVLINSKLDSRSHIQIDKYHKKPRRVIFIKLFQLRCVWRKAENHGVIPHQYRFRCSHLILMREISIDMPR